MTKYATDHPGGVDVLRDVAGKDASSDYDEVGHSEDADEILAEHLVGTVSDWKAKRSTAIKLVQQVATPAIPAKSSSSTAVKVIAATVSLAAAGYTVSTYAPLPLQKVLPDLSNVSAPTNSPFLSGFAIASIISTVAAGVVGQKLNSMTNIDSGFGKYPPRRKAQPYREPVNPHLVKGFLDPKEFKGLKVARIDQLSSNVFRYVFKLPGPRDVVGLPIGQHVTVKATIDGKTVQRSYTPTSNNLDRGVLELVIKIYPDGQLTGKYFSQLKVGDEVLFRGPKGAMRYQVGHCKKIGMIAGGTGLTPMYQLIRAICEHETDTTEVSLILANQTETDILLRKELEAFARRYPKNFKLWYMLDRPPQEWAYGSGFVTADVMREKLPAPGPDTKFMLCGPPGMVNASKKALVSLGAQAPGAISRINDDIFCF